MPFQIYEERGGVGSAFGEGVRKGMTGENNSVNQFRDAFVSKKQMEKQKQLQDKENEALKKNFGVDLTGITDPKQRQELVVQALKGQQENSKSTKKEEFLSKLFGNQNGVSDQKQNVEETSQSGFDPLNVSDAKIAEAALHDPNLARVLQAQKDVATREKTEKNKAKEKKLADLRAETLPARQKISERAEVARQAIQNTNKLMELIETGNIDDPTFATLAEALPLDLGKRLLSPETVEYKSGLIQNYGDLKNLFTGATRVKELEILEDKIANIYLTDEQKKVILKSRLAAAQADIIREEAATELEGKPLSLLEYNREVEKKAKPKLDALFNRILDEQNFVIKDAENQKKLPLDPNNPEDIQIIDQILKEANGDWKKAEKIATKKGYTF